MEGSSWQVSRSKVLVLFLRFWVGNPGSELPEGLKALFRPITVMVPDFQLIIENMFMGAQTVQIDSSGKPRRPEEQPHYKTHMWHVGTGRACAHRQVKAS
eukprot:1674039-Amphidinium_carterae.1